MNQHVGKVIIIIGVILMTIGFIIYFFHDKLNWLGKLPGDIRYESEHSKIYFPVVTMLVISVLLNFVLYLVKKFIS